MRHSVDNDKHLGKVRHIMKGAGYKTGGQNHSMKKVRKVVKEAIHKHEKHDHPGKPLTKFKDGGHAEGKHSKKRLDKMARGGVKSGKGKTQVNVIVAGHKDTPTAPLPAVTPMARPAVPPVSPAAPLAAGTTPPMRPMGLKTGGKAAVKMDAGAGGGKGRLEKAAAEKKIIKGKKRGGEC